MDSKRIIPTDEERRLALDFAKKIECALKEQNSAGNAAAARLTSHNIGEREQMLAKLAEICFCKWANVDYRLALGWDSEPDKGTDVIYFRRRWDVKHTERGRYLLWPFNKVHTLEIGQSKKTIKDFDHFVLVVGDEQCMEIAGWCTRQFFEEKHLEAHTNEFFALTKNTRILDRKFLRDVNELLAEAIKSTNKPSNVAGSTWEAYIWLRKYHPERLTSWLATHPEIQK